MAKKDKGESEQNPAADSGGRGDSSRHDSSDAARQAAVAKMKAAQAADEASDNLDGSRGDDGDNLSVQETEIDPKAQKALSDLLGATKAGSSTIKQVKVYSPFRVYYDSEASSVSAINGTGPFDVLPSHKNFLSLLAPGDIVVRSASGKEERITIERGVMHVHEDIVKVFLDV